MTVDDLRTAIADLPGSLLVVRECDRGLLVVQELTIRHVTRNHFTWHGPELPHDDCPFEAAFLD